MSKNQNANVRVVDVVRSFGSGEQAVHVLRGINLEVNAGEMIGLYGPSGSGKSLLLKLIAGFFQPDEGEIVINNKAIFSHRRRINSATLRHSRSGRILSSWRNRSAS